MTTKIIVQCPDCLDYAKKEYGTPPGKIIGHIVSSEAGQGTYGSETEDEGFIVTRCGREMKVTLEDCTCCHGVGYFEIESPECPKCKFDREHRGAPIGKMVRNPWARDPGVAPVYDNCPACYGTGHITEAVIAGILAQYGDKAQDILQKLGGAGDHYYFHINNMYVGVEWCVGHEGFCHT